MESTTFFTASIFKTAGPIIKDQSNDTENHSTHNDVRPATYQGFKVIDEMPNMISAGVINGEMIELEHSKLVGPQTKFKTVINYRGSLREGESLGVTLLPQDKYLIKPEN